MSYEKLKIKKLWITNYRLWTLCFELEIWNNRTTEQQN